jgi:hypothetical protein
MSIYGLEPPILEKINNLAFYYSELILTFDPEEVPLSEYIESNDNFAFVEEYALDIKGISTDIERLAEDTNNRNDVYDTFFEAVIWYTLRNPRVISSAYKFVPFKYFKACQRVRNYKNPPTVLEMEFACNESERFNTMIYEDIQCKIDEIIDLNRQPLTKMHRKTSARKVFSKNMVTEEEKDMFAPSKLSVHHIIPKSKIIKFLKIYKHLLTTFEDGQDDHTKSIYKIFYHNKRKIQIIEARYDFEDTGAFFTNLEIDENFIDYGLSAELWPLGLLFYGPQDRSDDPENEFEINCDIIVGPQVYYRARSLYDAIDEFLNHPSLQTSENGFTLYERLYGFRRRNEPYIYKPILNHWVIDLTSATWSLQTISPFVTTTENAILSLEHDEYIRACLREGRPTCSKYLDKNYYDANFHKRNKRTYEIEEYIAFNATALDIECNNWEENEQKRLLKLNNYDSYDHWCQSIYIMLNPILLGYCLAHGYSPL